MELDASHLDSWNYALFSIEMLINTAFLPIVLLFFYICVSQKNLHVNFRSTLFITGGGFLIGAINRIILVAIRVCCIARRNDAVVDDLSLFQWCGMFLSLFGSVFVVIERAVASVFCDSYRRRCTGFTAAMMLCGAIVLLSIVSVFIKEFNLVPAFDIGTLLMECVAAILCLVALIVMLRFNVWIYRKRHESMMQLADRYRLDENIRSGVYYIPVAMNDFLCKAILSALIAYSVFFTDIPLGQDTTHLSHAYDLTLAYQRIFFGLALTLRSEKIRRLMKQKTRVVRLMDRQNASNYFDGLKTMWS